LPADDPAALRRCSFGASAGLYDSVRPSYPPEAARWLLGDAPLRVVDLGAGTGIFSRVLAALGHDVVAVEPDPEMRELIGAAAPGIAVLAGSAEEIPLAAASVDAVVAAQAFHWFANDAARAEIARVVRTGGVFGPVWNLRDDSVPWVAELTRTVLEGDGTGSPWDHSELELGPGFAGRERAEFRHSTEHTAESLRDLVRSRSKYLVASAPERRRMDAAVEAIAAGLPEVFELPYVTVAYRARRLAPPPSGAPPVDRP
jgi:SAM-dependent methyltransferase